MEIKKIDESFSVGPQIAADDVAKLKESGFKAIVVNRPDGEAGDQPDFSDIETAAKAVGMSARHIPVVSGKIGVAASRVLKKQLARVCRCAYAVVAGTRYGWYYGTGIQGLHACDEDISPGHVRRRRLARIASSACVTCVWSASLV